MMPDRTDVTVSSGCTKMSTDSLYCGKHCSGSSHQVSERCSCGRGGGVSSGEGRLGAGCTTLLQESVPRRWVPVNTMNKSWAGGEERRYQNGG